MSSLKEETKRQVRALLLSAPKGLTVRDIQNDFKCVMGKALPFQELGYSTAEDLFRDMPDVVRQTRVGGEVVLRGVADRTTEHIERLVSRQKVSTKRRRFVGSSRRTRRDQTIRTYLPTRARSGSGSGSDRPTTRARPRAITRPCPVSPAESVRACPSCSDKPVATLPVGPAMPVPVVPAFTKGQFRTLFLCYPEGIPSNQLDIAYVRRFGNNIDCAKLGFKNSVELVRSLSDIVTVEELAGGGCRLHGRSVTQRQPSLSQASRPRLSLRGTFTLSLFTEYHDPMSLVVLLIT